MTTFTVPAAQVFAGNNDRTTFDPAALTELAASIAANGIAQPPTVRPVGDRFEIVCGERRFRAMTEILGWVDVPVVVRDYTDQEAAAVMLAENVARADLNPIDEANAYQRRMTEFGMTQADLAAAVGVPAQTIYRRVVLLKLRPEIQKLVADGNLPQAYAQLMTPLDRDRQVIAAQGFALPLAAFRALCSRLQAEQDQETMFDPDTFLQVDEYLAAARLAPTLTGKARLKAMIAALADKLPADDVLVVEARELVAL